MEDASSNSTQEPRFPGVGTSSYEFRPLLIVGLVLVVLGIAIEVFALGNPTSGDVSFVIGSFFFLGGVVALFVDKRSATPWTPRISRAHPARPASERFCPSCGVGNMKASLFCHMCGKPLPPHP